MLLFMSISTANLRHLPYIVDLAKKNADALGFLTREATAVYIDRRNVTLARENGDPCGFLLTSRRNKSEVRIFQACVQYDARGLTHGINMLSSLISEAAANGTYQISLHCRDGLQSNAFWKACGLHLSSIIPGGHTRRRVVNVWSLQLSEALHLPTHPYAANFLSQIRSSPEGCFGATPPERTAAIEALIATATAATNAASAAAAGSASHYCPGGAQPEGHHARPCGVAG